MGVQQYRGLVLPTAGLTALALVVAVAGCNRGKPQDTAQTAARNAAASARQHPASAAEQTAAMVEAATLGKANAPLKLKFEITARPVAGQTIVIDLALIPAAMAQSATLHFDDSPGLVFADKSDIVIGALQPESVSRQEVRVTAASEGVYFLGLTATMTQDSLLETRRFSIPVIVAAR